MGRGKRNGEVPGLDSLNNDVERFDQIRMLITRFVLTLCDYKRTVRGPRITTTFRKFRH